MKWFSGGVLEAIASAKSKNAIFVVFVMGQPGDEGTSKLNDVLEAVEMSSLFDEMVCIKVETGSTACNQFSQIYPVIIVPSVFFIDSATGVDLEINAVISKESLTASVNKAISKNLERSAVPEVEDEAELKESPPDAAAESTSPDAMQTRVDHATALLNDQVPVEAGSVSSHGTPTSLEDRVTRAKRLLAERQLAKQKEEEDKEKKKEIERRDQGKLMRESVVNREEQEALKAAQERKKEKADDKAAMEAVRAQIKQDREERKAKYDADKEAEIMRKKDQERKLLAEKAAQAEKAVIERSETARLQFRLPDGRHQTKQFPSSSALSVVYDWVGAELDTGFHGGFSLSTTFPRRDLDAEDPGQTLKQLELAPSACVLVLPLGGVARPSQVMSLLTLLLTPFQVLWAAISSLLGLTPTQDTPGPTQDRKRSSEEGANSSYGKRSAGIRQDGNVRRLGNREDEDDENNTWNGNSTQQM